MYTDQDIANLVARVQQLEQQSISRQPSGLPSYGIFSKNFLTRAFSVWGLFFVANLLIGIGLSCIGVILGLALGTSFIDLFNRFSGGIPGL